MPKFQINVYVKDIIITSYYVDADDKYEAFDKAYEMVQEDLYLDVEDTDE